MFNDNDNDNLFDKIAVDNEVQRYLNEPRQHTKNVLHF